MEEQKSFSQRVKETVIQCAYSYKHYYVEYEYLLCSQAFEVQKSCGIGSVKARKNTAFAVNLLSTVGRKHGIIDVDLIRKLNNHYCKMSGNGSHHL